MNKNFIFILLVAAIISYLLFACSKKNQSIDNNSYIINILEQENNKRMFWEDSLYLIIKINIDKCSEIGICINGSK